jgi:membrane-associated PAP2 superfamily phosphatase
MTWGRQIGACLLALAAMLAIFESTNLDLDVQDRFFDFPNNRWVVDKDESVAKLLFYTGPKTLLVIVAVACAAGYGLSFRVPRLRPLRRGCLLMALAMVAVPTVVLGLKEVTHVCYPCQIRRYGGPYPYAKVLERYPPGDRPRSHGRGWPASHAAAGLSLMMLYFACPKRKWKIAGLAAALAAGWAMGIYQTVNGQHYLSHTIASMILAWMVIVLVNRGVEAMGRSRNPTCAALAGEAVSGRPLGNGGT